MASWESTIQLYVYELKDDKFGPVLKTSWTERKKDDAGNWIDGERLYVDVKGDLDVLKVADGAMVVKVTGNISRAPRAYEKRDGSGFGVSVTVWANKIEVVKAGDSAEAALASVGAKRIDQDDERKYGSSWAAPF